MRAFLIGVSSLLFLVGLWAAYGAVEAHRLNDPVGDVIASAVFGFFAAASGAGGLHHLILKAPLQQRRREAVRQRYPTEPWRWPEEWRHAVVEHSDTGARNFAWFFALSWLAILSAAMVDRGPLLWQERAWGAIGVVVVLFLLGVIVLEQAIAATRRVRLYGRSQLDLVTFPGRLGEVWKGRLLTGMREPPKALRCTLSCQLAERVVHGGQEIDRRSDIRWRTLWEHEWRVSGSELEPARAGLAANLECELPEGDLPRSAPLGFWPDDDPDQREVVWRLAVEETGKKQSRNDVFRAHFDLPIWPVGSPG